MYYPYKPTWSPEMIVNTQVILDVETSFQISDRSMYL